MGDDGIDHLQIRTHDALPELKRRQVLVKVMAVSLNYRDIMIAKNQYLSDVPQERIPTSDGAGEVVAVGADVTDFKAGDRVASLFTPAHDDADHLATSLGGAVDGMLTEYNILDDGGLIHFPSHLTFEEAATLPCAGLTAWRALHEDILRPVSSSDTVVTLGTGGVSIFAIQFARAAGARVISTTSSDDKIQRLKEVGASDTINYKTTPEWGDEVIRMTNGKGANHIIEIGGAGTLPQTLKAISYNGQAHLIGFLGGKAQADVVGPLITKAASMRGILVGNKTMFKNMNKTIEFHQIKPVISKVFSFDEAKAAYKYLFSGQHFGKVVIRVSAASK